MEKMMIQQNYDKRGLAREVAMAYLGTLYRWGGDDPSGFDCSGFVIEILQSVGKLLRKGDWSAGMLATIFPKIETPTLGCLVFYDNGNKTNIIHVEFCLNEELSIGASGGGSTTLTQADAISQNAYIKIRPFRSRGNLNCFVDPFAS